MRAIILDCNVLYSALGSATSVPARVLDAVLQGEHEPLLSDELMVEYRRVLTRAAAMARHGLGVSGIDLLLTSLAAAGRTIPTYPGPTAPDPHDQHLWDLLASEPDAVLVTGDGALLRSNDFPGRIVSPRDFAERFLDR